MVVADISKWIMLILIIVAVIFVIKAGMKIINILIMVLLLAFCWYSFFTEEVNIRGNTILESDTEGTSTGQKYIVFSTGNQYTYIKNNKSIYKNNSKIASDIEEFNLKINNSDGKTTIEIELTSGNISKTTTYALKN